MKVTKFILEDVRCFKGHHEFDIRPLTFITGGNSTGKSTILESWQLLANTLNKAFVEFDSKHDVVADFEDVVRVSSPKKKQFKIGFEIDFENINAKHTFVISFAQHPQSLKPAPIKIHQTLTVGNETADYGYSFNEYEFDFGTQHHSHQRAAVHEPSTRLNSQPNKDDRFIELGAQIIKDNPQIFAPEELDESLLREPEYASYSLLRQYAHLLNPTVCSPSRPTANSTSKSEVGHYAASKGDLLQILGNLLTNKELWAKIQSKLEKFGKDADMFSSINVVKGRKSDIQPFKIEIRSINSPKTTILGVGSGISHILPILVKVILARPEYQKLSSPHYNNIFLMQHPDVYLFAKGQAVLTSFFVNEINRHQGTFIIETHSDYMIDRVRIEIMQERLNPETLSMVYLEPKGRKGILGTNMGVDSQGNYIDYSKGFKEFFHKELNDLLGF